MFDRLIKPFRGLLQRRREPPVADQLDRWTTGSIAITRALALVVSEQDAPETHEFIQWLHPEDLVMHEHRILLAHLHTLVESEAPRSSEALRALVEQGPIPSVTALVLNRIVASLTEDSKIPPLDEVRALVETGRIQQKRAREHAVSVARQVVSGDLSPTEGAGMIAWVDDELPGQGFDVLRPGDPESTDDDIRTACQTLIATWAA